MAGRTHVFAFRPKFISPSVPKNDTEVVAVPVSPVKPPKLTSVIQPGYNRLSEGLRKKAPAVFICLTFCGGRKCRFDTADRWPKKDTAIDGLYSHWVTENILAMARPNEQLIQSKDIIGQFIRAGIKTIINLQVRGEHSYCGPPLTSSGFSYFPEIFMENEIYYYNFAWKDYEHGTLEGLLDAVKVLSFAVTQGKVAVHCHAGLGRTGVLLCCYLIYSQKLRAVEAIRHVRRKRPNSVQTSGQLMVIQEFEQYLLNCSSVFSISQNPLKESIFKHPFTLRQHLEDQQEIMHGYEARVLRYIPKIVYVICERLLYLCRADLSPVHNFRMDQNRPPFTHYFNCFFDDPRRRPYHSKRQEDGETLEDSSLARDSAGVQSHNSSEIEILGTALCSDETRVTFNAVIDSFLAVRKSDLLSDPAVKEYCLKLDGRPNSWANLSSEKNPQILASLLWHWLLHLRKPILTNEELSSIVVHAKTPDICFARFDLETSYTVEYLLRFIQRLCPPRSDVFTQLLCWLASALTQQAVIIRGSYYPDDGRKRLGQGTLTQLLRFLTAAIQVFTVVEESPSAIQE